jgi:hypothetical protein
VTREEAARRTLETLRFFEKAPEGPKATGVTGYKGFLYHFLDLSNGHRFKQVELSTIDTTLFLAGALFAQSYFDRDTAVEKEIRQSAEKLYLRAEWPFFQARPPKVSMGWTPEGGQHDYDWIGYNEAMILLVLALGSPTHPISESAWETYTSTYQWGTFHGQEYVQFGPLFGYQYSHVWIDFRGIQDAYMRGKGIDYFENSRRATLAHRAYAIANPMGWKAYGESLWGLTACDGPADGEVVIDGVKRRFSGYAARGVSAVHSQDDGTIAPTAAGGSVPFAPEVTIPVLEQMRRQWGDAGLWGEYGFLDAFNPTFRGLPVTQGRYVEGAGWFDTDYLGIDQGPILAMIENHRSGLVWSTMRKNPHIVRGLRRAGFTGGWLDAVPR